MQRAAGSSKWTSGQVDSARQDAAAYSQICISPDQLSLPAGGTSPLRLWPQRARERLAQSAQGLPERRQRPAPLAVSSMTQNEARRGCWRAPGRTGAPNQPLVAASQAQLASRPPLRAGTACGRPAWCCTKAEDADQTGDERLRMRGVLHCAAHLCLRVALCSRYACQCVSTHSLTSSP
jgi:hypothetical protein